MYGIAVSVMACLRGGTRVDVAWNLEPARTPAFDAADALAITPGGGRLGSLLGGAIDGQLVDAAGVPRTTGRIVEVEVGPIEAPVLGLELGSTLRCLLVPATELPDELWPLLLDREPIAVIARLDGDDLERVDLFTEATIDEADDVARRLFSAGESSVAVFPDAVITVLWPRPTLVVFGTGEIPTAIGDLADHVGWATVVTNTAGDASALAATLSAIDGVVVFGHDSEMTGRVLEAALGGHVGYIGSIGPRSVRDARDDWLAYRGLTDLGRVRSPAGLAIGARNPREIAVAVVGEMIATQTGGARS